MPSSSQTSNPSSQQVTPRQPPRPPNKVLQDAEQQWIFTEEELEHTPSAVDGMSPKEERELRSKGVNFILQVGAMLKIPQVTISTAAVYFNRFLMRMSLVSKPGHKALHHYVRTPLQPVAQMYILTINSQQVAAIALFLATKVEETCRKTKALVVACCRVAQKNPNLLVDEQTRDFWKWRDTILLSEDLLLETICFDLTVEAPHRTLFEMLKYYNVENNKRLRNAAWAFINDSNLTQLCVLSTSRTIAAAALYCGAKLCDIRFADEDGKPWWEVQHVKLKEIRRACNYMCSIYEQFPSKDGAESIYVGLRNPEDGDPRYAETRLRNSQIPESPPPASVSMERTTSSQSLKRSRDDAGADGFSQTTREGTQPNGDRDDGERESKRAKFETNGTSHGKAQAAETTATQEAEEGSEEGELEE